MTQWWPLAGLCLTTPRLELRLPTESDLDALASRGLPATDVRLRLDRQTWAATSTVPVTIHGLGPCLPMFGLAAGPPGSRGGSREEQ